MIHGEIFVVPIFRVERAVAKRSLESWEAQALREMLVGLPVVQSAFVYCCRVNRSPYDKQTLCFHD